MVGYSEKLENRGLNGFALRMIAWAAMIWGSVQHILGPGIVDWASYMLLFSFSIFAFLLSEGLAHSTEKKLYLRRLVVFTIISEPCYDLYFSGKLWDMSRQSIMFTLLLGFIVLLITDYVRNRFDNMILTILCLLVLGSAATRGATLFHCELARYGVLIIGIYYICSHVTYTRLLEFICFIAFLLYAAADNYFNIMVNDLFYSISDKSFALIGALVTWAYNGKRGPNSLALKWIYYAFFPVMLLILYGISYIINQ